MKKGCFIGLLIVIGLVHAVELQPEATYPRVGLSVVRRVVVDYYLLSKNQPIEFKVGVVPDTGCWLRVYTRLWRPSGEGGRYSIVFKQGDSIRRFELSTTPSSSTLGPAGQRVGRWRSFFVRLQPGRQRFSLVLDSASSETVAVRLSFQSPRAWDRVQMARLEEVTVIKKRNGDDIRERSYYRWQSGEPFYFTLTGPGKVRLKIRLNFEPVVREGQNFLVRIEDNGRTIVEQTLRVRRDLNARYGEISGVLPSVERQVRFSIGEGVHRIVVVITGAAAKNGVFAVERSANEKYE